MLRYCLLFLFFIMFLHCLVAVPIQENKLKRFKSDESFITEEEYGKYLYNDPRGISCKKCHGEYGEERKLTSYVNKGINTDIIVPNIAKLDVQKFYKALRGTHLIMPKYYLTDSEIFAIYKHVTIYK